MNGASIPPAEPAVRSAAGEVCLALELIYDDTLLEQESLIISSFNASILA